MDYFTKETYNVRKLEENMPVFVPWYSTFAILELFDNQYYFNGVRSMASPNSFEQAVNKVKKLFKEKQGNLQQLLIDYYPEILAALLEKQNDEDFEEKEVVQYTYKFSINDRKRAENFLYNDEDFLIEQWDDRVKLLIWVGDLQAYEDSEMDGQVQLAEVFAHLEVKNKQVNIYNLSLENS